MNAAEKINNEMQKAPGDKYLEIVGHYLIDRATMEPMAAERIMAEGKTLSGAWKAVTDSAKKQAKHGCACLSHPEVFAIIDDYFGLVTNVRAQEMAMSGQIVAQPAEPSPASGVVVNLADFL